MGRHRYIKCEICSKDIRSDWIKKHVHKEVKKTYSMKNCSICKKKMIAGHLSRHMKTHDMKTNNLMKDIMQRHKEFEVKK